MFANVVTFILSQSSGQFKQKNRLAFSRFFCCYEPKKIVLLFGRILIKMKIQMKNVLRLWTLWIFNKYPFLKGTVQRKLKGDLWVFSWCCSGGCCFILKGHHLEIYIKCTWGYCWKIREFFDYKSGAANVIRKLGNSLIIRVLLKIWSEN